MRIVVGVLLLLAGSAAWAEWVKVTEAEDAVFYVDTASIRSDGPALRRTLVLQDLKRRYKDGELSRVYLKAIDCKEKQDKILSFTQHAEHMGRGRVIASDEDPGRLGYVMPNTPPHAILNFVCSR